MRGDHSIRVIRPLPLVSQILWSPDHYFDELVMKLHDPNPEWLEYDFEKHLARANREKRDTGG